LNAGDATMKGLEVELDYDPQAVQWFGLQGYVSYLDAEPDSFLDANDDGFVDTQVITNAPDYTASLRLKLDAPVFGGLFTALVGGNYRDDAVLTNEGGPDPRNPSIALQPIRQDAYTTVDASINWLSGDGKWGLRLNGYNLTDEEYLTSGYNIPVLGVVTGAYGAPVTVTAGLEYRFF
jgi:iron complex outermembrane receptor protein